MLPATRGSSNYSFLESEKVALPYLMWNYCRIYLNYINFLDIGRCQKTVVTLKTNLWLSRTPATCTTVSRASGVESSGMTVAINHIISPSRPARTGTARQPQALNRQPDFWLGPLAASVAEKILRKIPKHRSAPRHVPANCQLYLPKVQMFIDTNVRTTVPE